MIYLGGKESSHNILINLFKPN